MRHQLRSRVKNATEYWYDDEDGSILERFVASAEKLRPLSDERLRKYLKELAAAEDFVVEAPAQPSVTDKMAAMMKERGAVRARS
jgi:hypothetical protein